MFLEKTPLTSGVTSRTSASEISLGQSVLTHCVTLTACEPAGQQLAPVVSLLSCGVCAEGVWFKKKKKKCPQTKSNIFLTKANNRASGPYCLNMWMDEWQRAAGLLRKKKRCFPQLSLIRVPQPIITGFSRPMWVNPVLHKASSNDSVFCCRWWV